MIDHSSSGEEVEAARGLMRFELEYMEYLDWSRSGLPHRGIVYEYLEELR